MLQRRDGGQAATEFALVVPLILLLFFGIFDLGRAVYDLATITNAAREGARNGSIYIYDASLSKAQNDLARNELIRSSVLASMNLLTKSAPQFSTSGTWSQSGQTYTTGDLVVSYVLPSGVSDTDARVGQQITVRATYHQDLVIPMIAQILPKDANGRLGLMSEVTMVAN